MESLCAAAGISPEECVTVSGTHTWMLADPGTFAEVTNVAGLGDWETDDIASRADEGGGTAA